VSALIEETGAQSIVGANGWSKSRSSRQEAQSGNGGRRELHDDDEYGNYTSGNDDDLCAMDRERID
jgi:hypothetical protein